MNPPTKRALIPSAIDNFVKLMTHRNSKGHGYLFVGKSMLIKEFADSGADVTRITRPRRFGKTLNLSMLEHFFAAEVNGVKTLGLFEGLSRRAWLLPLLLFPRLPRRSLLAARLKPRPCCPAILL